MTPAEAFFLQEGFKLILRDGYDFVKRFLPTTKQDGALGEDADKSLADAINAGLGETDQQILLALLGKYKRLGERLTHRIKESSEVIAGEQAIELQESTKRLEDERGDVLRKIEALLRRFPT